MKHNFKKTVVIALGGSIVCPDGIDIRFINNFKKIVAPIARGGTRFVIVVGGGRISRVYQDAAAKMTILTDEDKDWIGIHATRLNAHLFRTVFRRTADPAIIDQRHKTKKLRYPVTVASGWRPGWSTDFVTAALAHDFDIQEFIVAGKPDGVYTKDPDKNKGARRVDKLSWRRYRKLVPKDWKPGLSSPVDPVAARYAEKHGLQAIVLDGRRLTNLENLLKGREFNGTIIE